MRCRKCMHEVPALEGLCPHCGKPLEYSTPEVYQLKPGTILNSRYELVSVLGFGGFGVVYKAWDSNLHRAVAIKEYFPTMYLSRDEGHTEVTVFDGKNKERFLTQKDAFLQEARSMAVFNEHPNIVHVFDYFEENGTAYFVMEFMDGRTVGDYLKEAKSKGKVFTVDSAVHIVREVLNALKATHAKGIIHRDIKPQNIYVLNNGTIKLYDFGAARFSNADEELTRTVIITPGYAPAEQYQTRSKQGEYTDIYALGAVLYELLTGIRPDESINRKVKDEVIQPSHLNSKIPSSLESVILRAMAVPAEIRFQSASEFDRAIANGRTVRNVKKEIRQRMLRRNMFVIVLLSVLLLGFGYTGWQILDNYFTVYLAPVTLSVWVPAIDDDIESTRELYESIFLDGFRSQYPHVNFALEVKPQDTYEAELKAALVDGKGPDAFDSTMLGDDFRQFYASVDTVYEDSGFEEPGDDGSAPEIGNYYFLEKRKPYFEEIGKVPLLMNFAVLYNNFDDEDLPDSDDYQKFIDGKSDYIGTVLDYDNVQRDMAGKYEIQESFYSPEGVNRDGEFLYFWSINKKSFRLKRDACGRLIHYLLSSQTQEELAVNRNMGIPLYKDAYNEYMNMNGAFSYLTDILEQGRLR